MEELKAWWHWIATAFIAGGVVYDYRRQVSTVKSKMENHEQLHKESKYITQEILDRTQANCQQLLFNEISHVKELMTEIKDELKAQRGRQ
jgi:hypothetical protein